MSLKKDEILKVHSDNLMEKSLLLLEVFLSLSPPLFLSLQIFFSLTFSLSANLTLSLQKLDFEKVLLQAHKLTFHRKFDFPHNSHIPTLSQQSFPLLVTSSKLIFLPPSLSLTPHFPPFSQGISVSSFYRQHLIGSERRKRRLLYLNARSTARPRSCHFSSLKRFSHAYPGL